MAQIVADTFVRADGALGANWTNLGVTTTLVISSNRATISGLSNEALAFFSGAGWTGGNDQYSEAAVGVLQSTKDMAPACRVGGASIAAANAYLFVLNDNDAAVTLPTSSLSVALYKQVSGSFTQIGSSVTGVSLAANDIARLEVQGTTLRGKINGVQIITGTDATLSSGNPGLYIGSGASSAWGNASTVGWAAGDFGGGATRGLFRPASSPSGVGIGGSFFRDPLQAAAVGRMARRASGLYVPERMAA